MIQSVIMVALGGALGSAARYVVSRVVQEQCATAFGRVCGLADSAAVMSRVSHFLCSPYLNKSFIVMTF